MSVSTGFFEQVQDLLAELGPLQMRRMFGGAGLYADGVIFGLLDDDTLYLKVDAALAADLEAAGSQPFRPVMNGEEHEMRSYWRLPDAAMDDAEAATAWGRRALAVGRAAAAAKARKPKR